METLEYNVLKETACNPRGEYIKPSVEEMRQWVTGLHRRRSLSVPTLESPKSAELSFRELELRYDLQDVWGCNTTPSMQTLECIQKVKQALVEGASEDSISSGTFAALVALSVVAAMVIVLLWELYLRPRHSSSLPL